MGRRLMITLAAIALVALPQTAAAAEHSVKPPGFSSLSQYTEVVPTASGVARTDASPSPSAQASGSQSRALARIVASTAPPPALQVSGGSLRGGAGESAATSVAASVAGSGGGLGLALPVILIAGILAVLGVALHRRRARS
jgi:hypothetical protein